MSGHTSTGRKETKGERTARRILDIAEDLFARQGYDGTSLRQIAADDQASSSPLPYPGSPHRCSVLNRVAQ